MNLQMNGALPSNSSMLRAHFLYEILPREMLQNLLSYKKRAHKMMMKLTPGFAVNIFHSVSIKGIAWFWMIGCVGHTLTFRSCFTDDIFRTCFWIIAKNESEVGVNFINVFGALFSYESAFLCNIFGNKKHCTNF